MINVIIVTHGALAEELLASAEKIAGKQDNIYAIEMPTGESLSHMQQKMETFINGINNENGVLILVDMVGGTPCNAVVPLCRTANVEVVTGVNLPMILTAMFASKHFDSAKDLADKVYKDGQRSIVNIKRLF
ncbi:MAG: PTS sugar transporter subunit IIA [Elusimicrobiota bacterium]|jgi:PTS system mannose-specific IIA component|nr:PTS sugar transporter subunit IIA [Elusimicrobiota bacterium]